MNKAHSAAIRNYMAHQGTLGSFVHMAATVAPKSRIPELVQSRYHHSVALATRFYTLMSVASGHSGLKKFPKMELAPDHIANALAKAGDGQVPGAAQTLVLSGGRDLITKAVAIDPLAEGWDWEPEPGACEYCTGKAGPGNGAFRAHYDCGCVAAPRFRGGPQSWPISASNSVTSLGGRVRLWPLSAEGKAAGTTSGMARTLITP